MNCDNKLKSLQDVFASSNLVDIVVVGGLVKEDAHWTVQRIVGKDPIYLRFDTSIVKLFRLENVNGCEIQIQFCSQIELPAPVYDDDPDCLEFKLVTYSVFDLVSSNKNAEYVSVSKCLAYWSKSNLQIVRALDLFLSSGFVCRFDPFSFDGMKLCLFAERDVKPYSLENEDLVVCEFFAGCAAPATCLESSLTVGPLSCLSVDGPFIGYVFLHSLKRSYLMKNPVRIGTGL